MTVLVTGSRGRVASTLIGLLDAAGVKVTAGSKNPADLSPPPGSTPCAAISPTRPPSTPP